MDRMRAARLVERGRIVCESVARFAPQDGQVVVKNHMAAICGSDLHQVFFDSFGPLTQPMEPGWPFGNRPVPQRLWALWKDGEWNSIRIRMVGEAPHLTLWINGSRLWEAQMPKNDPAPTRTPKARRRPHPSSH